MRAGDLDHRLQFQKRQDRSDGAGNTLAAWVTQFDQAANLRPLRGGEGVLGARLEGRRPVIITIRRSVQAAAITHEWQAVDLRDGRVYQIKEPPRLNGDRDGFEMLSEEGAIK